MPYEDLDLFLESHLVAIDTGPPNQTAIKCRFGVASDAKLFWKIMVVVVFGPSLSFPLLFPLLSPLSVPLAQDHKAKLPRKGLCVVSVSLKTLTSLNKEVRPFFLGDNSIWSFPCVSSLSSDYSISRSSRSF